MTGPLCCDTCRGEALAVARAALEVVADYCATPAERAVAEEELSNALAYLKMDGGPLATGA